MLDTIRTLFDHLVWADRKILATLRAAVLSPEAAVSEFGHGIGADEIWLARLEQRPPLLPVWPEGTVAGMERMAAETHERLGAYLARLEPADLGRSVSYANSAGAQFENRIGEILLHLALHAQYHRGKVNLMLRQAGLAPAPVDLIAFLRGADAAVTPPGT